MAVTVGAARVRAESNGMDLGTTSVPHPHPPLLAASSLKGAEQVAVRDWAWLPKSVGHGGGIDHEPLSSSRISFQNYKLHRYICNFFYRKFLFSYFIKFSISLGKYIIFIPCVVEIIHYCESKWGLNPL